MKKIAWLGLLPLIPAFAQQPKFETADVHPSTTLRAYVQSFGGVVREGRYINREATMLVSSKPLMAYRMTTSRAVRLGELRSLRRHRESPRRHESRNGEPDAAIPPIRTLRSRRSPRNPSRAAVRPDRRKERFETEDGRSIRNPAPASRSRSPARRLPTFPPLPTSKWRVET